MKKSIQKTLTSLLLVAALCISGLCYQAETTKAATTNYTNLFTTDNLDDEAPVAAGQTVNYNFKVSSNGTITLLVYTLPKTAMTLKITSATGVTLYDKTILSTDDGWYEYPISESLSLFYNGITWKNPTAGTYTLSLTFEEDTYYMASAVQEPATQTPTQAPTPTAVPYLTASSATVTVGFSQTISVNNNSGAVTWKSSNSSVASVSNGKITGKKKGTATITAKTASGYTMNCKVTVKKNEYSVKKLAVSKVTYGKTGLDIYKVSYDKKGNLVIKARVLNNSSYKLQKIKNLKIKIKNNNGKVIGTYSAKNLKKVNLKAGKAKAYTFKIKKSKLKVKKKADLRLIANPSVSGKAYYIR
ncbi:MAG: Ig-like domain-containing protein [Eubacteriales bacterium]|nr:Ig-like domain-containing protein [Eubacteriales bacterium]